MSGEENPMSNESLTSQGEEIGHQSSNAGNASRDDNGAGEHHPEQGAAAISLVHAMTADEESGLQSKRISTPELAGEKQNSDTGLQAADVTSTREADSQDMTSEHGHAGDEVPLDRQSQDTRQAGDSVSQPTQKETDTQEKQQRQSEEAAGADGPDHIDMAASGKNVKHIVEAALLASGKPLSIDRLLTLFLDDEQPDRKAITEVLEKLQQEYEGRGIEVREVSTGWRIQVRKEYASWVSRLWEEKPGRYSRALLETLSLIAYRQPITRGEIEDVRGVAVSTNIVKTLLERDWVRVVGHRDVPGRPSLYATTREFLDYFGLKSLDELPTLAEIKELDDLNPSLDLPEPGPKTDLQEAHEEETPGLDETTDVGLPDDAETEKETEQLNGSASGAVDDEELPESQDDRLH